MTPTPRTKNIEGRAPQNSFRKLAEVADQIETANDNTVKAEICSRYFSLLERNEDLDLAVRFLGEGVFPDITGKHVPMGSRTLSTLAANFCKIDYEKVFKPCREVTDSVSETIELLFQNIPEARTKFNDEDLTLNEVLTFYEELYGLSTRRGKQQVLANCWKKLSPLEVKYFIRIMSQSSPCIVPESKVLVAALSRAFNQNIAQIRHAYILTGSLGKTTILAKNGKLDKARFTLFHPVEYMTPIPAQSHSINDFTNVLAEEKLDGLRCQVHLKGEKVKIFSEQLNDITSYFPEIVQRLSSKNMPGTVLDGVICIFRDDTILPSQLLKKRLKSNKVSQKSFTEYPAVFIAFDLLFYEGHTTFKQKLTERRNLLSHICQTFNLSVTIQKEVTDRNELEQFFNIALKHGSDGLVLKHKNSLYEYGRRSVSWLNIEKPRSTLKAVIMYAHTSPQEETNAYKYSHFTLGISVRDDQRYEEEFIPIGKIKAGLMKEGTEKLTRQINELTVEKYGPTLGLIPKIVAEVDFDDIKVNPRTKAKYFLSTPHLRSIRRGLDPADIITLKNVEETYTKKINQSRLSQQKNPAFENFSDSL